MSRTLARSVCHMQAKEHVCLKDTIHVLWVHIRMVALSIHVFKIAFQVSIMIIIMLLLTIGNHF